MNTLRDEVLFFMRHFKMTPQEVLDLPIFDRKDFIERFIEQREKEEEMARRASRGR